MCICRRPITVGLVYLVALLTWADAQCVDQAVPGFSPDWKTTEILEVHDNPPRYSLIRGGVVFGTTTAVLPESTCVERLQEITVGVVHRWWLVSFRREGRILQGWIHAATEVSDRLNYRLVEAR